MRAYWLISGINWQLWSNLQEQQRQQRLHSEQDAAILASFQSKVGSIAAHQIASHKPSCKAALHATCHVKHYQWLLVILLPSCAGRLLCLSQLFYICSWSRQNICIATQAQPALSEVLYVVFETATTGEPVRQAAPLPKPLSWTWVLPLQAMPTCH